MSTRYLRLLDFLFQGRTMIVKREVACVRCSSETDVSGDGASAITDCLPFRDGSIDDDLSQSIPDTTRNDQEITTPNFVIYSLANERSLLTDAPMVPQTAPTTAMTGSTVMVPQSSPLLT